MHEPVVTLVLITLLIWVSSVGIGFFIGINKGLKAAKKKRQREIERSWGVDPERLN